MLRQKGSSLRRPNAILIIAHPGHELLVHHWMEVAAPMVFALTDGSGSGGIARTQRSKEIITATGASIGPMFGLHPDKLWYSAILERDIEPFARVVDSIVEACSVRTPAVVVSDPVEYFNPMHDLCSIVARCVVRRMPRGVTPRHLELSIEHERQDGAASDLIWLDAAAADRKSLAISRYHELNSEIARHRAGLPVKQLDVEQLCPARCEEMWPPEPPGEPLYEAHGRRRIETGTYSRLITYVDHVRPLARRIAERYGAGL
jgi:hypothetical protein